MKEEKMNTITMKSYVVAVLGLVLACTILLIGCGTTETSVQPGQSLGIASVPNLRDLGGYDAGGGATVASRLVYRSNQLCQISAKDMEKIAGLGLKVDFDLRTADERNPNPDELPPGVKNVWLDVLADSQQAGPARLLELLADPIKANAELGNGKAEENFKASYRQFIVLSSAKKSFGTLFTEMGKREQLPAIFHCTTGKDRTGWTAAAFLTLLGVSRDEVMKDYLRSNDYIIPLYQKVIDAFVAGNGDKSIPLAILGVKKEYLEAAFDEMKKQHDTIEKYFTDGLGIDASQQKALKDIYLVH